MKALNFNPLSEGSPKYLAIASLIREAIQHGQIKIGEALPSSRNLAAHLQVHRHTVMLAMDELEAEGWIRSVSKRGYFVNKDLPSKYFKAKATPHKLRKKDFCFRLVRHFGEALKLPPENGQVRYAFQSGLADLRLFPVEEFRLLINEALKRHPLELLGFGEPAGHGPLIEELKKYLRRVRNLHDRDIIVTHGSQEAIFLTAQLLVGAGDNVAVEALGYPPAWEAIRAAGAKLIPVRIDKEGMDPEDLARVFSEKKIRLLYLTPTSSISNYGNLTGISTIGYIRTCRKIPRPHFGRRL